MAATRLRLDLFAFFRPFSSSAADRAASNVFLAVSFAHFSVHLFDGLRLVGSAN
jgi:hypothetical protein